ncbi:hypothetical protein H4R18_002798 [Coemansia javaensis]|uniref:Uncharacterized protein n=1 Tax=Coemansia javaensis TaxID=2761396 RepID=A0A9W8HC35_9FUNG|nr:hypothetical protein H4R18_002798 [Coemansia javaensis]
MAHHQQQHWGPPPRNDSQFGDSQYPQGTMHHGGGGGGVAPPPMAHQQSMPYDARAGTYVPPQHPSMSRPMSQYNDAGPPRHGRMSSYGAPHSGSGRTHDHRQKTHYGHLVNDKAATMPCGGTAWKGCCKYNTLGCLFCFNGCMRLCGCGVSLMETLHMD